MPTSTPWGKADHSEKIARGIMWYNTPGHGGVHITDKRRAEMPEKFRNEQTFAGGNWYEEDCDWALVAYCFPQFFPERKETAEQCLRQYRPHLFEGNDEVQT